jgi:acyl transferase domain-containing protein/3-hydroxymyristoyl/3-hydroxydecanoyl-(acyl carrier protein) dehydratase/1-acyl-sn-glycerol-3-phosphate acyltransferase
MRFEPIAIVGQSCLLPGALDPESLWRAVVGGQDLVSTVPRGYWQLDEERILAADEHTVQDRTWSLRGGYVRGFEERFDAGSYSSLPAEHLLALDPIFQWVLHGVREALTDAGVETPILPSRRTPVGLVLGNLAYTTPGLTRYAERRWYEAQGVRLAGGQAAELAGITETEPRNRFCSGYPAHFAAEVLGLAGPAFSLDAACASSIYAIKLACDRLYDRSARMMVAGAVNHADDLFIHVGFCALKAMSRSGRSRPFDKAADGLVPAEGAAFVVLKRLEDAIADDDRILGVIRGIGLSNDGRSGSFLVPSEEGQLRAMRAAYESAGIDPFSISLLECHATGTPVGDTVEARSASQIFAGARGLPIGSLKSNLGHLIAAAGMAGLLKVLGAMRAGQRPPTLNVEDAIEALADSPLRLLQSVEPWDCEGPRRAAVSAFGFGGNNGHLIVEEWTPERAPSVVVEALPAPEPLAIIGLEAAIGAGRGEDFVKALREGAAARRLEEIEVRIKGLRFPPRDLAQTLPQQLLIMEVVRRLAARLPGLPAASASVLVGMGCDAEISRYVARWRLPDRVRGWRRAGLAPDARWLEAARDAFVPGLEAAGVIGTMPNIPANRLNTQLDFKGPSYTVAAEETSGLRALEIVAQALRIGEIDAAIVGAVDLSQEPVHTSAARAVLPAERHDAGDGAVAIALKRLSDAERDGDEIIAVLEASGDDTAPVIGLAEGALSLTDRFGHAHAASGLLHLAAAATALDERLQFTAPGRPALPWLANGPRRLRVEVEAMGAQRIRVDLREGPRAPRSGIPARISVYSGADAGAVRLALEAGRESKDEGPARLVIAARDEGEHARAVAAARRFLDTEPGPAYRKIVPGAAWCGVPIEGDLGFVFTGAAAAYPGMGRELLLTLPRLGELLAARFPTLVGAADWMREDQRNLLDEPFRVLEGSTFLCQAHALLTQELLGLHPQAVLGVSSGETNGVFALGAWRDLDDMFREIFDSGMYQYWISGDFECVRRAWGDRLEEPIDWRSWRVLAPVEEVEAATAGEPFVRLTMINAPADCVIAGQADGCKRVIEALGGKTALLMGHDIVAHCPELVTWKDEWYALHHRKTTPLEGVRFYSNASGTWHRASADATARALTEQAVARVDFRRVVEAAWQDGVRVFLEHGPRGLCSGWIDEILGDRSHLAVALDRPKDGPGQVLDALAALLAAGLEPRLDEVLQAPPVAEQSGRSLRFPAHAPPVLLPDLEARPVRISTPGNSVQHMPLAPWLPPILPAAPAPALPPSRLAASSTAPLSHASQPARPNPTAVRAIVERMQSFHAGVSAAHQQYLDQQGRALERLLSLRENVREAPAPAPAAPSAPAVAKVPAEVSPTLPDTPKAPAKPAAPALATDPPAKPSPKIDRRSLKRLASGKISKVFGPLFEPQDGFRRQVRMPEPPLLLADRVTGIDAEPGSLGTGTIWTETDVTATSWYLHQGRMPAGIMVEAGQADLLLISWLGVDFENRGERVYRLLGCELTYHGALPGVGDTLRYAIHIDGYAKQGPVRLFFFHYDCHIGDEVRLSVRHAQAGFFTDAELANSAGILWEAESGEHSAEARVDAPLVEGVTASFTTAQVRAYSEGRVVECFGPAFAKAQSHVRTPRIQDGRMLLFDEVSHFDPRGGPWGRGYLRAEKHLSVDEWFFDGHFKNDPCMPGTLMFEGCLQAMAFYMAAQGTTIDHDGWRFEPVPGVPYKLRCRGQVIPGAEALIYELFVETFESGPIPRLTADLLCTVDGLKVFHIRGMKLQLIPSWPLESRRTLLSAELQPTRCARLGDRVFDFASLVTSAWGKPSDAFGPMYRVFDGVRRCPRLPGPPYHFMSRITKIDAEAVTVEAGGTVEAEYDIPPDAWYFSENGVRLMPFCVLLEVVFQPCGWLASYIGCALATDEDLFFRNLDGTGTLHADIFPDSGTLTTRVKNTRISRVGSVTILDFDVECFLGETLVYDMKTIFGFFTEAALASQVGLPASAEERARLDEPGGGVTVLKARPPEDFLGELRLAGPMLFLIDRVTGLWLDGGAAGLGRIRGVIDIDADQWFFKSHFYGDPVQPGALGIEAMLQLLQVFMVKAGMQEGIATPRFEAIALGVPMTWKYRGQVLPHNKQVTLDLEIVEREQSPEGARVVAKASYWVDGMKIYEAEQLGMRIVPEASSAADADESLDPEQDVWLKDHCPTWTVPALAMMSMVDRLAAGAQARAPGRPVVGLRHLRVVRWLSFADGARGLKLHGVPRGENRVEMRLLVWEEAARRYELIAVGEVLLGDGYGAGTQAWAPLEAPLVPNPYETKRLFHGPAFQALLELRIGDKGSSSRLDATPGRVPVGILNQRLLDAAMHGIPHDNLACWSPEIPTDQASYPVSIPKAHFYGPPPTNGEVRCEARFAGFTGGRRFPTIALQLIADDEVWAELTLVGALFPKGPLGLAEAHPRWAFLVQRRFVPGLSLSRRAAGVTKLRADEVEASDWLAGSVAQAYGCREATLLGRTREVAMKEHVAHLWSVHPSTVRLEDGLARSAAAPLNVQALHVEEIEGEVRVRAKGEGGLDLSLLRRFWRSQLGVEAWFGEDFFLALIERFVSTVRVEAPDDLAALGEHGCLFIGNHQVGIESLLFSIVSSALIGRPTSVIAKSEHRHSWIGRLLDLCFSRPGLKAPRLLVLVDREDQKEVLETMTGHFAKVRSGVHNLLVHSEGTRALHGRKPVTVVSTAVIDAAVAMGLSIVPVRFARGLPVKPLASRLEFPVGYGRQEIWLGAPIAVGALAPFSSVERRTRVLAALNGFGGLLEIEEACVPDPQFAARVCREQEERGLSETSAVLSCVLADITAGCAETARLRAALAGEVALDESDPIAAWMLSCVRSLFGTRA